MRYKFIGKQWYSEYKNSAADTALVDYLDPRGTFKLKANQICVCYDPEIVLTVGGGNADGDDVFGVAVIIGTALTRLNLWLESIAQASLLQNASFKRFLPSTDWTKGFRGAVVLNESERLMLTATAGGAAVIYQILFCGWFYIYEEVEDAALISAPVTSTPPQRVWWQ